MPEMGRHVMRNGCLLLILLTACSCLTWGCNNTNDSTAGDSSQAGQLSFQLRWHQTSADLGTETDPVDCDAVNVDTIILVLFGPDLEELARGGPWNCESHEGRITGVKPTSECTAVVFATDPVGVANYRTLINDIVIVGGQETNLGIVEMQPFAIKADAGPDQNVVIGEVVTLDAIGSYCNPDMPLAYQWELMSAPNGSSSSLTSPNIIAPKFVADLSGSYTYSLIVSDGYCSSLVDTVSIQASLPNGMPTANAGEDRSVVLGRSVTLDGSASSDPENDPLSFNWEITARPDGSVAQMDDSSAIDPTFEPDLIGNYTIRLTVSDGKYESAPDSAVITAVNTPPKTTISTPLDASVVYLVDPVFLSGSATDDQDGAIPGDRLTWSSNIDGTLGSGSSLELTNLTLGAHRIMLTAVDAHGATDKAAVDILVYYQRVVDTGQTQSFTDTNGEDADYLINPFSYEDNGNGTVGDKNTGLMWEQTAGIYGGYTVSDAETYCEDLVLGGYTDWRVPDRKELVSIISYWNLEPSINTTFFNTYDGSYFSSDRCEDLGGRALVDFGYGKVWCDPDYNKQQVRCVRSGVNPPYAWTEGLIDNGDGTVTDQLTGLMWQQEEYGEPAQGSVCEEIIGYIDSVQWETALTYCQNLQLGGHDDWRLPNIKELESITDENGTQTCFNMTFFPHACGNYWSSTSFIVDGNNAYYYENHTGQFKFISKSQSREVKCVRGGQ